MTNFCVEITKKKKQQRESGLAYEVQTTYAFLTRFVRFKISRITNC